MLEAGRAVWVMCPGAPGTDEPNQPRFPMQQDLQSVGRNFPTEHYQEKVLNKYMLVVFSINTALSLTC